MIFHTHLWKSLVIEKLMSASGKRRIEMKNRKNIFIEEKMNRKTKSLRSSGVILFSVEGASGS